MSSGPARMYPTKDLMRRWAAEVEAITKEVAKLQKRQKRLLADIRRYTFYGWRSKEEAGQT